MVEPDRICKSTRKLSASQAWNLFCLPAAHKAHVEMEHRAKHRVHAILA